jgi:hypothetical protein
VAQQVLRALEPVSLELSMHAAEDVQRERQRLTRHWDQQRQRARYDVREAERRYRAVDPENRLVARTLELQWEEALRQQRQVEEAYEGFCREKPTRLSEAERGQIRALSEDIPALWQAAQTTAVDRKAVIRALVERVVVEVRGDSDQVGATVYWQGGGLTRHTLRRTVARYDHLQDYDRLVGRIAQAKREGLSAAAIADKLNEEGFQPPSDKSATFNRNIVVQLFQRIGLSRARRHREKLGANEWWFRDLAEELEVHPGRLRHWLLKGYVHSRKAKGGHHVIAWADRDEMVRLRKLGQYLATEHRSTYPDELTTPKPRKR